MATLKVGGVAFDDFGAGGLVRPAAEKFAGAWLACLLVMARGNVFAAFSMDHILLATICGTVGAMVTVVLLLQMDRTTNSVGRQATIAAVVTLIGDVFCASVAFSAAMGGAAGHGRGIRGHRGCAVVRKTVGGLRLLSHRPRECASGRKSPDN